MTQDARSVAGVADRKTGIQQCNSPTPDRIRTAAARDASHRNGAWCRALPPPGSAVANNFLHQHEEARALALLNAWRECSKMDERRGCGGLPHSIRTDNVTPFASGSAIFGLSKLSVWWLRLGKPAANNFLQQQEKFDRMCGRVFRLAQDQPPTVFAGQNVGVKEVEEKVWLISFMHYDLGFFDHESNRFECAESPFAAKVLSMSSV